MIAKVYRINPELVAYKCVTHFADIDNASKAIRKIGEAAQSLANAICEAFNNLDWSKLINEAIKLNKRWPPREEP
jgi:uncharacterized protein with HEPN domain